MTIFPDGRNGHTMDYYDRLESKSIYVIREAYYHFKDMAMLWSVGKDSTALLWLVRKAFFGRIPFPIVHLDTGYKFPEMYEFRTRLSREWGFDLIIGQNKDKLSEGMGPHTGSRLDCCTELKTRALTQLISRYKFRAILLGIRRDEHGIRAKERYFSPRDDGCRWDYENQPAEMWDLYRSFLCGEEHCRIHPILHFTELDIWKYIKRENIPIVDLYSSRSGKRYRSIGCAPCCHPVESEAETVDRIIAEVEASGQAERAGRSQDKESIYAMQKLRALGYM